MTAAYQEVEARETAFEQAEALFASTLSDMKSTRFMSMTHEELETVGIERATEMARLFIQGHVVLRGAKELRVPVRGSDGVMRGEARSSTRKLRLLVGGIVVPRLLYQAACVEGLCPQDASLGLPQDSFSLGVRRRVAEEVCRGSFDSAVDRLGKTTAAKIAKRQAEQLAAAAAVDFCDYYEARQPVPTAPHDLMVLSFDGAGIIMRTESLRPVTQRAAEKAAGAPVTWPRRLGTGEKRNRKRMAEVAAVYELPRFFRTADDILGELDSVRDRDAMKQKTKRPRPVNKRVWASVERDAAVVIREAFAEAKKRDPDGERTWIVLVDGQDHQLRLVERAAKELGVTITIVCDLIHVLEYMWSAANCFHAPGSDDARRWVATHARALLEGADPGQVAAGMRRSATLRGLEHRKAVDACADYLQSLRPHLRYGDALGEGLPIATGVIEGACRHIVRDRMDCAGARWSTEGAEAVLKLRALVASGDFDDYWQFHTAREQERNHGSRYADGVVPDPLGRQLRLVR